jgi:hypothetical protein
MNLLVVKAKPTERGTPSDWHTAQRCFEDSVCHRLYVLLQILRSGYNANEELKMLMWKTR